MQADPGHHPQRGPTALAKRLPSFFADGEAYFVEHPASVPYCTTSFRIAGPIARTQPGKVAYSSCGTGTAMHLAGELFKQLAKIDMIHVPYKGCGPAIIDGISGQVPILLNTITNTTPQAKGGRLRIVAIASATRSPVDKNLPTIAEAGLSGFDADTWFGFMGPPVAPGKLSGALTPS